MYQFHRLALGVFQPQRVLHQLDAVAVRVLYIGGVSAAIRPDRGCSIGDAERVQVGDHFLPVVNLDREMARWGRVGSIRRMNLSTSDLQLELPVVKFRPTVQELGAEYLLIPLLGSLAVTNRNIDMLDKGNPGHRMPSFGWYA